MVWLNTTQRRKFGLINKFYVCFYFRLFVFEHSFNLFMVNIFIMHALNTITLLFKPQLFYQPKEDMQLMDEESLNNYLVIITSVVGVGCLLVSIL